MLDRDSIVAVALTALSLTMTGAPSGALAHDESKYPDWSGQWLRVLDGGPPRYDTTKPIRKQEAPLKPEYQALYQASLNDIDAGGFGLDTHYACMPMGMPRQMSGISLMEFLFTPGVTYILYEDVTAHTRRIYTDGRDFPKNSEPTFAGYSIGRWIDSEGAGRYDSLEIETRGMKGPRAYDTSGLPLHSDNQTIVKERLYLDKDDGSLRDEITTFDDALTRPWTVIKKYVRDPSPRPNWLEAICTENNPHVRIQNDNYFIGADGLLMPAKKGQKPPDLKYFGQAQR